MVNLSLQIFKALRGALLGFESMQKLFCSFIFITWINFRLNCSDCGRSLFRLWNLLSGVPGLFPRKQGQNSMDWISAERHLHDHG